MAEEPHKADGDKYLVGDWGSVSTIRLADSTDVLIEYDASSLEARRSALVFAKELVSQAQDKRPGMRAEFVVAGDHYHVLLKDFGSQELRVAHALYDTFTRSLASHSRCACCPHCRHHKP
jgi:hypothetical protein